MRAANEASPAGRRWRRRAGVALAVVVTVTAGVVVYRGDGSPKVEVTAGHRPSAGDNEAPPSVDETTSSTEAATTSSTGRSAPGSTATTATTHRVQAPTSSTTATTHRATTTTTAGPTTTTTTAPAADPHAPVDFAPKSDGTGGWLLRREGSVTALGSAQPLGDAAGRIHDDAASRFHNEAVGIATTPSGAGYWIATARGEVFPFGDATPRGSMANTVIASPIVDFSATHTSEGAQGYLMTDGRGNIYDFSTAAVPGHEVPERPQPVVAVVAAPSGVGHWLLQRDGKVEVAPDSLFVGGTPVNDGTWEAVDIAVTPSGRGYWVMTDNFGVFSFGDAQFKGSAGGVGHGPAVAIVANPAGDGYWEVAADGAVYGFGAPHWL